MRKVGNPNIGNEAKKAGTTFKKGQSGNPKGRPKKGIHLISARLKKMGYEPAKKVDINEVMLQLVQVDRKLLKEVFNDKKESALIRIVAGALLGKGAFENMLKVLTMTVGTAPIKNEFTGPDGEPLFGGNPAKEFLKEMKRKKKKKK